MIEQQTCSIFKLASSQCVEKYKSVGAFETFSIRHHRPFGMHAWRAVILSKQSLSAPGYSCRYRCIRFLRSWLWQAAIAHTISSLHDAK